jgi:hypothetical protein
MAGNVIWQIDGQELHNGVFGVQIQKMVRSEQAFEVQTGQGEYHG